MGTITNAVKHAGLGFLRLYAIIGILLALFALASTDPAMWHLVMLAGPGIAYYTYVFTKGLRAKTLKTDTDQDKRPTVE